MRIFQNSEEYFERFPKFMKYNDYVTPCKQTYACVFIGIITITKTVLIILDFTSQDNQCSSLGQEINDHQL